MPWPRSRRVARLSTWLTIGFGRAAPRADLVAWLLVCLAVAVPLARAADSTPTPSTAPLHEQIDHMIAQALPAPAAERSSDEEFVRRIYLDLLGSVPAFDEVQRFLADERSDKRVRLIDELLERPEHARRLATWFDVTWMERRPDANVAAPEWQEYLRTAFRENRPLNQLLCEILSADGTDPVARPAAKFYLDRNGDTNLLVRDVGRLMFGMDLQCAQCHDHPLVNDYEQAHYYGLLAYLERGVLFTDKAKKVFYAEKGASEPVTFKSVFTGESAQATPQLPGGSVPAEPKYLAGCEHVVAPADGVMPVPRFSRRQQLAHDACGGQNAAFNRNLANRLWAFMLGRGIVHPPDMHHADNPPSHPELLALLTNELVASGFNVRSLMREIALSETYQRTSQLPAGQSEDSLPPQSYGVAPLKPLSPEQLGLALLQATGQTDVQRTAVASEFPTVDPKLSDLLPLTADEAARRDDLLERALYARLAPNLGSFTALFGLPAGSPQDNSQSTVHQALFLANAGVLQSWLTPGGNDLTARLAAIADNSALADELYLSVLARHPDDAERGMVVGYLAARPGDRTVAIQEMAWGLLTSTEFRFNH
ncbi:MAG: DUF1549 and DUF1553 domain-containing protein [Pirellulales bacterium]|nr:DUF1549 and DUF1553 domain-containing protein [Pirellulales bacterium]